MITGSKAIIILYMDHSTSEPTIHWKWACIANLPGRYSDCGSSQTEDVMDVANSPFHHRTNGMADVTIPSWALSIKAHCPCFISKLAQVLTNYWSNTLLEWIESICTGPRYLSRLSSAIRAYFPHQKKRLGSVQLGYCETTWQITWCLRIKLQWRVEWRPQWKELICHKDYVLFFSRFGGAPEAKYLTTSF